jgi:DNA-directed RNA polymerase subunit A"
MIKPKNETLKNIRKVTTQLMGITLKGISGINRAIVIEKADPSGKAVYSLATEGTNLKEIFNLEEVDAERTVTNDIMEIASTLGIEAARNAVIHEITKVLQAQDLHVDQRHIMLIADAVTFSGEVKSIGRHGLAGEKASVLARAAFEETAKHLLNACIKGETDRLSGITENILIGQTIPCGTGNIKVVMNAE